MLQNKTERAASLSLISMISQSHLYQESMICTRAKPLECGMYRQLLDKGKAVQQQLLHIKLHEMTLAIR